MARKAVGAVGRIALRLPGRANTCTYKLVSLLSMEISHITSEALISLASELCNYDTVLLEKNNILSAKKLMFSPELMMALDTYM